MMNTSAGKHGVVFNLRLLKRRAVAGNDNKLGCSLSQGLQGGLDSKSSFATLHDKGEMGVDALLSLFLLLGGDHCVWLLVKRGGEIGRASCRERV